MLLRKQKTTKSFLSIPGFGLSLVDSTTRREVAYMAVTSSGVTWEMQRKKRFKRFKPNDSLDLEIAYQQFLRMMQARGLCFPAWRTEEMVVWRKDLVVDVNKERASVSERTANPITYSSTLVTYHPLITRRTL